MADQVMSYKNCCCWMVASNCGTYRAVPREIATGLGIASIRMVGGGDIPLVAVLLVVGTTTIGGCWLVCDVVVARLLLLLPLPPLE